MKRYCLLAVVKGYWPPINGDERARCGRAHDHDKIVMVETQKLPMESRAVLELRMLWSTRAMLEVNGGPEKRWEKWLQEFSGVDREWWCAERKSTMERRKRPSGIRERKGGER